MIFGGFWARFSFYGATALLVNDYIENTNYTNDEDTIGTFNLNIANGWDTIHILNSSNVEILTNANFNSTFTTNNGTLQFVDYSQLSYTPNSDWFGTEEVLSFYGSMNSGIQGPTADISITINAVDDPPVMDDFSIVYVPNQTIYNVDLLQYTTDVDNTLDNVSYSLTINLLLVKIFCDSSKSVISFKQSK